MFYISALDTRPAGALPTRRALRRRKRGEPRPSSPVRGNAECFTKHRQQKNECFTKHPGFAISSSSAIRLPHPLQRRIALRCQSRAPERVPAPLLRLFRLRGKRAPEAGSPIRRFASARKRAGASRRPRAGETPGRLSPPSATKSKKLQKADQTLQRVARRPQERPHERQASIPAEPIPPRRFLALAGRSALVGSGRRFCGRCSSRGSSPSRRR